MKPRFALLTLLSLIVINVGLAQEPAEIQVTVVKSFMKQIREHSIVYASEHDGLLPQRIEDLAPRMRDDPFLLSFVSDPNFSFEIKGGRIDETDKNKTLCSYHFLSGKIEAMRLDGTFYTSKKDEHIKSLHTTPASAPR